MDKLDKPQYVLLLIIIPTRGDQPKIIKVLECVYRNLAHLKSLEIKVEYSIVIALNGGKTALKLDTMLFIPEGHTELLIIKEAGKVNAIINSSSNKDADFLITLDDDIVFDDYTFFWALSTLIKQDWVELVGFQSKILPYPGHNIFRRFMYDVINIKLLISLYHGVDPFLFGRFLVLRGCKYPVPSHFIVDDIYLSLYYYGKYVIRPEFIFSYGKDSIFAHINRVVMLENARRQVWWTHKAGHLFRYS